MYWYGDDVSGWGYVLMIIGMAAFWGLVITGVVLLLRRPGRFSRTEPGLPTPLAPADLLLERFARGEIDEDEYSRRLTVLHGQVRS